MPDLNPAPAEAVEEHDDLGAALEANYDAIVEAPSASPSAGSSPAQPQVPAEGAGGEAGRARDQLGRYTKAELAAQAAAGQQPSEFKVPEKWPANVRAKLEEIHKANPEYAQFVLEQYSHFRGEAVRNQQYHEKRIEKLATVQKQVEDLLAPGRQQRALAGIDDVGYIRNLVAAGDILDKNPKAGLKWLAQKYGVDLSNLDAQGGGEPAIPPAIQQVMDRQARIEQALQQQYVGMEETRLNQASSWVNDFASQADPQGQPLYPHFDAVLPEIIVNVQYQMQSGQQVDVKAAYDRAIRMNDQVWLKEQSRTSEASRNEAKTRAKREIEDAKRAGLSVSGSGASPMESVPDDLGAHLERNYDRFIS